MTANEKLGFVVGSTACIGALAPAGLLLTLLFNKYGKKEEKTR